jgi:hypothetical protein
MYASSASMRDLAETKTRRELLSNWYRKNKAPQTRRRLTLALVQENWPDQTQRVIALH